VEAVGIQYSAFYLKPITNVLWRIFSTQELCSQRKSRCWVMHACDNERAVFSMRLRAPTVAMQRPGKYVLSIIEAMFSLWSLQRGYKRHSQKMRPSIISLIKIISYLLSQRKFRVSVECEMYTTWDIQARVPQVSVLSSTLYSSRGWSVEFRDASLPGCELGSRRI
jgi:hypothetical protein